MRFFSPYSPCPQDHLELDPRLERGINAARQAIGLRMSQDDVLAHLMARGFELHEAVNLMRAAEVMDGEKE